MKKEDKFPVILLIVFLLGFIISGINPKDYLTWGLEIFPAVIGVIILIFTYKRFRFTNLTYSFIFIEAIVLLIGGHYTYANVPFFSLFNNVFGFNRNNYDRLAHLLLGFVPALIAKEIAVRNSVINGKKWTNIIVVAFVLAIGAFYEIFEGAAGITYGARLNDFLGTQGDPWDTQWDMFCDLIGAVCSVLITNKYFDKKLKVKNQT